MNDVSLATRDVAVPDVMRAIWRRKLPILGATFVITLGTAITVHFMAREYSASVLLAPVGEDTSARLGAAASVASQLSGLASLAGFSTAEGQMRAESIAMLESQTLTDRFISELNLLPVLFNSQWDKSKNAWKVPGAGISKVPTLWRANQLFKTRVRSVTEDNRTGLVTMTITWTNPKMAAEWANVLVRMTNDYLREQAIEETTRNVSFLQAQAGKTNEVELRAAIYQLMEAQIRQQMLARGTQDYALRVLDPAVPPEVPSSPRPLLWTAIAFVSALLFATFVALLRSGLLF